MNNSQSSDLYGRVMLSIEGASLLSHEKDLISNPHVGGIIFFARNFISREQINSLCDEVLSIKRNIVIAVDQDWKKYYQGRTDHPISEAENVSYDHNLHAIEIGKHISSPVDNSQNMGEFMGLLKISKNVIRDIVNEFEDVEKNIKNTDAFQNAKKFQNAYLTDFIQYLIDKDYDINCCINKQGWYEVDTLQDLDLAEFIFQKKGVED